MLEIHAIRREDLLTAFSLSADLLLRSRLYALAERKVLRKRNTIGGAVNRRSPKNAFSEAASIFGLRQPLRGLKGASSPFLVGPARRNRWCFSGSLLARKREQLALMKERSAPRTGARTISDSLLAHKRELSFSSPPAQYSAVPHPTATRREYVPPAPSFSGGCGPASRGLPASGR